MNDFFNNNYEQIEKYCLDLMDEKEKLYFEQEINSNPALKETVEEYFILLKTFDHKQSSDFIHAELDHIHTHSRSHVEILFNQLRLHVNRYWKTASVAASVAFFASILTFMVARSVYKKDTRAQYQTLRKEINNLKNDQKVIKNEVDHVKKKTVELPNYPSKYTGTGFAISQSGYLVTNYHVIEGFQKIFVFTGDKSAHRSEIVAVDETNDLAILKITDEDFSFAERIPYSVRKANPNLAQRVYTLGYPKSEIVYNEGYISSITGFEGDSSRYQLELPSVPGVSGAPIIDETGNVIGIISGKQSQSSGITYAIRSKALLNLFKKLPKDFSSGEIMSNSIKGETRSNQVRKIQPYVCEVRVFND